MARLIVVLAGCVALGAISCDRPNVLFPRFERDHITTSAILGTVGDLAAASLAGLPAGEVDLDAACPGGGNAHISGTLGAPDGSSFDLTIDLSGCRSTHSMSGGMVSATLTLDGSLRLRRDLEPQTGWGTEQYTADRLALDGTIQSWGEQASIDKSCVFEIKIEDTETSGAVVGTLCERPVSWSYRHASCTYE